MPEWEVPHLHWNFKGEQVLFSFIAIHSFPSFLLGSLLLILLCTIERTVSYYHDKHQLSNSISNRSRWRTALWRGLLYWIAMILRLCYMLAAMTFNMGLIVVVATTLAVTQFIIEVKSISNPEAHSFQPIGLENRREFESSDTVQAATGSSTPRLTTRPRSKSKPDDIYIHPTESNIARADAMVHHLNLEERVMSNLDGSTWQEGKGRDLARRLLQSNGRPQSATHRRSISYKIGDDSDSDDGEDSAKRRLVG